MSSMLRSVSCLLTLALVSGDAFTNASESGMTCFMSGAFLIRDSQTCENAARALGYADATVSVVPQNMRSAAVGGCYYEEGGPFTGLWFNPDANSTAANAYDLSLCRSIGVKDVTDDNHFERFGNQYTCNFLGEEVIYTVEECVNVVHQLGLDHLPFIVTPLEQYSEFPAGCMVDMFTEQVRFNPYWVSDTNLFNIFSPICSKVSVRQNVLPDMVTNKTGLIKQGGWFNCISLSNSIITTADECQDAAQRLGIFNDTLTVTDSTLDPPGCFYDIFSTEKRGLVFNKQLTTYATGKFAAAICHWNGGKVSEDYVQIRPDTACPSSSGDGLTFVTTQEECLTAARTLGYVFTEAALVPSSLISFHPSGCFLSHTTDKYLEEGLYFNPDGKSGNINAFDSPICAALKTAPSGDYARLHLDEECSTAGPQYRHIGSMSECRYAAKSLQFTVEVLDTDITSKFFRPRGCYISFERNQVSVFFNDANQVNVTAADSVPICRIQKNQTYTITPDKTASEFYWGFNVWGEMPEIEALDIIPNRAIRMVRWGNLFPSAIKGEDPPQDTASQSGRKALKDYIHRAYGDRACAIKEFADALGERDISIMGILFDIPDSYTKRFIVESTESNFESRVVTNRAALAAYIAESVTYLKEMMGIKLAAIELTNEPNGLWDAYVAPEEYTAFVRDTKSALAVRGSDVDIIGPGISDLGSSTECYHPITKKRLPTCYLQELASDPAARSDISRYSIHPWDDVYDVNLRGPSFLDEAFIKWNRFVSASPLAGKDVISSEWGGINLKARPLAGQVFASAPQICYVNQTTEKLEGNMGVSPLWAARAFATFLVLVNSGVSDALYWSARDNFWSPGCFGLVDRAGEHSVLMKVFGPFFEAWPKGTTHAVSRSWPDNVEGRTEDVIVASITDTCRVVVAAANIQDTPATITINLDSDKINEVTSVYTINNAGEVPTISAQSLNVITLQSYAVIQIVFDNPACSESVKESTTKENDKGTQVGYAAFLWIAGFLIALGACYQTRKPEEKGKTEDRGGMYSEDASDDVIVMPPQVVTPIPDNEKPWITRYVTKLKLLVVLDIILHAFFLTQGGTTSGRFHEFTADYRQMGRLITDAWVYHAIRLGVCLVVYWYIKVTSSDDAKNTKTRFLNLIRPTYLCNMLLLFAKAHLRISSMSEGNVVQKLCWHDLTVSARVAGDGSSETPDFWFWGIIIIGLLFAGFELYFVWKLSQESVDAASTRSPKSKKPKKPILYALNSMRFFAAMHIVLYHYNAGDNPLATNTSDAGKMFYKFAGWGSSQLTFFFMLSGFILAYQYGDKEISQTMFWVGRFIRLYPLYLLSVFMGLAVMKDADIGAVDITFILLAVQKWTGPAMNVINTPGWAVGPFLLLYAIFPTLRDIMKTVSYQKRSNVVLPLCFVGGAMAALDALNENWTGVFAPLNHIFLTAHFASFLSGLVLGLNYLEAHEDENYQTPTMRDVVAVPAAVIIMFVIFLTGDLKEEHGEFPFWHEWARHGMLQPLVGVLLWYGGRGHDFLSRALSWPPLLYLGKVSFTIYLLQAPLFNFCARYLNFPYPLVDYECGAFMFMLVGFSLLVFHHIEDPLVQLCSKVWNASASNIPHIFDVLPVETPEFIKIIGYYCTMGGIFALFLTLAIFGTGTILRWEGDSYAFDLTDSVSGDVISGIKWLALTSLPVALIGFVGQVLFPPCRRIKVPSLEAMLDETVAGVPHFPHKIHFRIVTRGKAPLLVLENVETAARVLESCLPAEKYELEVVTDNDMELQSRTTTPVTEIVVPTSYKCPSGAKFKARALEYAIHNSNCTKDDWIVHQDEETRFEVETVQKIFYHCACEHAAIQSGKRRYGRIGQGVIVYGANDEIENWVTTLADSIRVADDYGKFRIQFELHEPLIGMHGSFVVASQAVEEATTFDHGMAGSVTEDAYFALVARSLGVKFSYIDAYMYEQSPFSILDFAKQRKRWFAGLWLVAKAPSIPLRFRIGLFILEVQWLGTTHASSCNPRPQLQD
eukprot:TRINITY_DN357_c0_g1_i2.p1 TRINITY_DN357_c0_g1~~TRINITY_DN357_c0_g1_i2.p1  ORF type:complete len:2065 (+),score=347.73 TRINITY_DN357_c0_g1_i2:154-6195(+)